MKISVNSLEFDINDFKKETLEILETKILKDIMDYVNNLL